MRASAAWSRRALAALTVAGIIASMGVAPPAADAQRAATKAIVRFPFPQDDGTLTPYTFDLGYPLVLLIYDTLMWRDADGAPQPWLATSMDTSADGRRLTLHLADNATWQDGQPLTSGDVAFTFDYVAHHPHPWFTPELSDVAGVRTPDPATVEINLNEPSPGFVDQPLSDIPILPRHLWDSLPAGAAAPEGLPLGSGPYHLSGYEPGQSYRFTANDSYFKGAPAVKELAVPISGDAAKTIGWLRGGQVDMVPAAVSADVVKTFKNTTLDVAKGASYDGVELVFNTRQPPFDQASVRSAVGQALDLPRLANAVGGDPTPADDGLLHPASPWSPKAALHQFDQRAAHDVLTPLHLPQLLVTAPDADSTLVDTAREVAFALRRAGVDADVRRVGHDDYLQALGDRGKPNFEMAVWRAPPFASYDPDFLGRMFASNPDDGRLNFSGYASPAFDDLARRVATTTDADARRSAVTETLRLLATDAPVVPLYFPTAQYAFNPVAYDGWVFIKGSGILDKRSFVGAPASQASPTTAAGLRPPPASRAAPAASDSGGGPPYGLVAAAFFGGAGLLVATTLVRRRRAG